MSAHTQALLAATKQAQRTLDQACTFAELHATAKPLFQRLMRRPGAAPVLVRPRSSRKPRVSWAC